MAYSLNPHDPFAEDEGAVLVVPADRFDGPVIGTPIVFVGPDMERPDFRMFHERRCSACGRTMVIPAGAPLDSERLMAVCPRRHEEETITAPEGFVRYTDTARLFDLAKMRDAEAWA